MEEAKFLSTNGAKELILIAQDLSNYGIDLYKKQKLRPLLEELVELSYIEWIRLHYFYPSNFPIEILDLMKKNKKICNYLDIPFQHISDNMLKLMRRGHTKKEIYALINKIRKTLPNVALRTTLIVGHPDESKKDFEELYNFVKEIEFDLLGVFQYSHEENSYSFDKYKDNISK